LKICGTPKVILAALDDLGLAGRAPALAADYVAAEEERCRWRGDRVARLATLRALIYRVDVSSRYITINTRSE
jgi:hypothetical protein